MSLVRFVHAADLHLDSPFKGLHTVAPHVAEALREGTFGAFNRFIDLCIDERVDALLVAGDVYDGADRSLRAQLRFIAGIERLDAAGIRSFVCHGNHDPLDGWTARLRLPETSHQFGPEIEAVPLDEEQRIAVYGVSYPRSAVTANLAAGFDASADSRFTIGLLHCNLGAANGHENYAPATLDTLIQSGIDYWALGHLHTRQILRERRPVVAYPGNPQGLHPNETGARGVYLVEIDDSGEAAAVFHDVADVRWVRLEIDVGMLSEEQALLDRVRSRIERARDEAGPRPVIYRIVFQGASALHGTLSDTRFLADLAAGLNDDYGAREPFAWCDQATAKTRPEFDRAQRREGGDFLATVLNLSEEFQRDPDTRALLWADLAGLFNHERFARYGHESGLSDDDLAAVIMEAEARIVEALDAAS